MEFGELKFRICLEFRIWDFGFKKDMPLKAFTIIELVISTAVLLIITVISISSFVFKKEKTLFDKDIEELTSNLKQAQTMALSGANLEEESSVSGYGFYFKKDSSSYIFFADYNGNKVYSGDNEKIEEKKFLSKIKIEDLEIGYTSTNDLYLDFQLPQASLSIKKNALSTEYTQAFISLKHLDLGYKTIKIDIKLLGSPGTISIQ